MSDMEDIIKNVNGWGFHLAEVIRDQGDFHWMNLMEHRWWPREDEGGVLELKTTLDTPPNPRVGQTIINYRLQQTALESPPFRPDISEEHLKNVRNICMENSVWMYNSHLRDRAAEMITRSHGGYPLGAVKVEEDFPLRFNTLAADEKPIDPYRVTSNSKQHRWEMNPDYEEARYQDTFYLHPNSFVCYAAPLIGEDQKMEDPHCRIGQWRVQRLMDSELQEDGTYRTFFAWPEQYYVRVIFTNAVGPGDLTKSAVVRHIR